MGWRPTYEGPREKESERNSVHGRKRNSVHGSERMNSVHGLERNEQWYCTVGESFRSWVWGGCESIIVIFKNIFGVPRCTIKYLLFVTSTVRGEICVRWVKTPDTCTLNCSQIACWIVGSCVFICWAGFHFLSESAGSTVKFLQLCIPAWDVVSPPSSGNCFFGSAEDGFCE